MRTLLAIALGVLATAANAAPMLHPALVGNGLPNAETIVDFDDDPPLPDGTVVTTQYEDRGVRFGPDVTFGQHQGTAWASRSGVHALLFSPTNACCTAFIVQFLAPVGEAAVWVNSDTLSTITALLDGEVVETYDIFTGEECCHVGFTNIVFDELRVDLNTASAVGVIDDVEFSAPVPVVPIPVGVVRLTAGCLIVWLARRRLRSA